MTAVKRQGGLWPSLRTKIFTLLFGLMAVILIWAGSTLWFSYRTEYLVTTVQETDVAALLAAQGLENALTMQKGYATYYFLREDPEWLEQLAKRRDEFDSWLSKARESAVTHQARDVLNSLESAYLRYMNVKDRVVDLYKSGKREQGAKLHWEVRDQFDKVYALCEAYKTVHQKYYDRAMEEYNHKVLLLLSITWVALPVCMVLSLFLGWFLFNRILKPLRALAMGEESGTGEVVDEIKALSTRMKSLVQDVDETHSQLKKSREHLLQTEKLAQVGKLAAGVAHSIRNPLTSVKMRLFSLERSLNLDEIQKEDFDVISEEIRHLDTIIRNFLEFSRRPKLKMIRMSPSDVVDTTLELLRHRLDAGRVSVRVSRSTRLPEINLDADHLKEALANLILNSLEAMAGGGDLEIVEEQGVVEPQGQVLIIRLKDNGPGIPSDIQDKIFEPFFSTKEEGTGLGLSIALRIIEEHNGWLHLCSTLGSGTTFVIGLPGDDRRSWHRGFDS